VRERGVRGADGEDAQADAEAGEEGVEEGAETQEGKGIRMTRILKWWLAFVAALIPISMGIAYFSSGITTYSSEKYIIRGYPTPVMIWKRTLDGGWEDYSYSIGYFDNCVFFYCWGFVASVVICLLIMAIRYARHYRGKPAHSSVPSLGPDADNQLKSKS
jgi:hypothetical protein